MPNIPNTGITQCACPILNTYSAIIILTPTIRKKESTLYWCVVTCTLIAGHIYHIKLCVVGILNLQSLSF